MPLFDALQGNFAPPSTQVQDGVGNALSQQVPGMGPPASQAEYESRKQGWTQALQNPALMSGLFQFGLALMSPGPVGQTGTGHVANALGRGANAVTQTQQLQQKNQLAQQEEARKARSSDAQSRLADAYTRKADTELATAPLKAERESKAFDLEIKKLDAQIKNFELQGRKAEADIIRAERDAKLKEETHKTDIDYKRQLTAESGARTKNVGQQTSNGAKNPWTQNVSKMDNGQTLISRYNKSTGESEEYIVERLSVEQVGEEIMKARIAARKSGQEMTKEDEQALREKLTQPNIIPLPASKKAATPEANYGVETGDPANLTPAEARALGVSVPVGGAKAPPSAAKPSGGQAGQEKQKAVFNVKTGGRVEYPDGRLFEPTTAKQEFMSGFERLKAEVYEYSRMRKNVKPDSEEYKHYTQKIIALNKEMREKYGNKAVVNANRP